MRKILMLILPVALSVQAAYAQWQSIRTHLQEKRVSILDEYKRFLSIPNIASDTINIRANANAIMQMMNRRGIGGVQLLNADQPGVPPVVYGEVKVPGATKTIIFYAHYDGQPVNPAQWAKSLAPFRPALFTNAIDRGGTEISFPVNTKEYNGDWRIYARGASDDKAGVFAIINAYQAMMDARLTPAVNLKFFFEGEEEAGSPHIAGILQKYRSLLSSDLWIICDGPIHQSGKKIISLGVRGDAHLDLTVYGPKRPLHSGHYGNWVPNPGMMLAQLLASMKNDSGKVIIAGFYDDMVPLSDAERKALGEMPSVDNQLKKDLGIASPEIKELSLNEAISLPSLNINGMQSGNVGKMASNQIPTTATAVIDLRLVPGNDWKRQQQKVIDHIRRQGYFVTDHEPTDEERATHDKIIKVIAGNDGYNAQRTSLDLPEISTIIRAVKSTTPEQVVIQPTMGGSLPLIVIEQILNAKTIIVPIANHDNNQHAENENIRLRNFFEGIETMVSIMLVKW